MEVSWQILLGEIITTLLFYGTFPILFAIFRKAAITRKKYRLICFIVNAFILVAIIVIDIILDVKVNIIPYILWTSIFTASGVSILNKKGLIVETNNRIRNDTAMQKLENKFNLTHKEFVNELKKSKLVKNASFETAVFLYNITILFLESAGFNTTKITEIMLPIVKSKCSAPWQEHAIQSRLELYESVVSGSVPLLGIWMPAEPDNQSKNHPMVRAQILLGDLLIYPDCAKNYENCAIPVYDIFEVTQFAHLFMTGKTTKLLGDYIDVLADYTGSPSAQPKENDLAANSAAQQDKIVSEHSSANIDIPAGKQPTICRRCGKKLLPGAGFCRFCGTPVEKVRPDVAEDEPEKVPKNEAPDFSDLISKQPSILRRAFILLEDEEWEKAEDYFERVLDDEPENAYAYLGKAMIRSKISKIEDAGAEEIGKLTTTRGFIRALNYADDALASYLERL